MVSVIMVSVSMVSVIMVSVTKVSVIMVSVVTPEGELVLLFIWKIDGYRAALDVGAKLGARTTFRLTKLLKLTLPVCGAPPRSRSGHPEQELDVAGKKNILFNSVFFRTEAQNKESQIWLYSVCWGDGGL
jgi:hypothetical protein